METSLSHRRTGREDGFALIEVMFSVVILAVGLLGLAALMASLTNTTTQSRYLGTEVMLASEKLEDLNQLPIKQLPTGGSIDPANVLAGFNDTVRISSNNGTVDDVMGGAALVVKTGDAPTFLSFQRLWQVEQGATGLGNTKRITVKIIPLTGTALERSATFQTSTVRPSTVGQ